MAHRNHAGRYRVGCGLLAGGLLLAASPAFAQEGVLFKNLMEGVVGGQRNDIEYRQRPPLVVPPNSTLPRPQDVPGNRSAAWPNDPDVAARRADARAARTPNADNEKYRDNPVLSQQELRRGRTTRQTGAPMVVEEHNTYNNQLEPIRIGREMASRQKADDLTALTYGSEPPRRTLSEPPVGYRRPAGSAPVGPGVGGPREDKQAVGQREFLSGTVPLE